ncbi:BTB/POZ domain-containing protein 18 [Suricata suricatta]|uniref:BTB/POZ domain-containing protein 18 n=1 Tax=Suricata suricatta TaxID=37032 RepID=A0A673TU20_SURSU|nr:BTB/POZ domain-containing protein 18 [Suricata suricatta]XP_029811908.1 BTB/POZ domain-containing protein 18 [Suricata suricatta]XP_029811909.1 BTB/POZ domain-containing protein 18 [Suricata suricatta]XP_029811910.1 BTB/POZ domain-containing protein 18 [Suricata suricatta]
MCSPASSKILYRNPRLLRLAFVQLHHQQQSGVFCDVLLQAEGEAVPAHCCILSACSPFFTERLERERPAQGRKVVLELGGLKIRTLRKLVDFLYTSEMEVSREEAQDVLSAARQLRVSELESLQLEGGKLVKAPQGRRLNRECLQPPSPAPISARVVASIRRPRTPLPVTQTPCSLGLVRLKSLGKEEGPLEKSNQQNTENLSGNLLLKRKARACPTQEKSSPPSSHSQGPKENKSDSAHAPAAVSPPGRYSSVDKRLLPRKIRLSRSKPSPDVCTPKPSGTVSRPSSVPTAPGRRLWRQKSVNKVPEDKEKPGRDSPLQSLPNPSGLENTGGSKKRSPEVRAPYSDSAEGQVGRVKLRKIVNGTCWEVVQEPPLKNSQQSPQAPEPECSEPAGTQPSSVTEQAMLPARVDLCQDTPVCFRLQDLLLSASHSPDHPVAKSEFGSSPEPVGKEPGLDIDCREHYTFDTPLLGPPCEAEEYRITSAAATSELEEILDFMLCGSDIEPPIESLEGPGGEGCRTPTYHLTETGKNWIEGEEWCLPDMELWPRELTGLEKEPIGENKEPTNSFSPLVLPSEMSEGEEVPSVGDPWTPDLEITSSQPLDGHREKLLHMDSLDLAQRPSEDLSPPCSNWMDTRPEVSLSTEEVLHPAPEAGKEELGNSELLDPFLASSEEEEIDVVDWTSEGRLVPVGIPSVWPDPSSESDTEVDILT